MNTSLIRKNKIKSLIKSALYHDAKKEMIKQALTPLSDALAGMSGLVLAKGTGVEPFAELAGSLISPKGNKQSFDAARKRELAPFLVPGYSSYMTGRRRRAVAEESKKINPKAKGLTNMLAEYLGIGTAPLATGVLGGVAGGLGSAYLSQPIKNKISHALKRLLTAASNISYISSDINPPQLVKETLKGINKGLHQATIGAGIGSGAALGLTGGIAATLVGALLSVIRRRRTAEEQAGTETSGRALAKYFIPGVAAYDRGKRFGRTRAMDEKLQRATGKRNILSKKAGSNKFTEAIREAIDNNGYQPTTLPGRMSTRYLKEILDKASFPTAGYNNKKTVLLLTAGKTLLSKLRPLGIVARSNVYSFDDPKQKNKALKDLESGSANYDEVDRQGDIHTVVIQEPKPWLFGRGDYNKRVDNPSHHVLVGSKKDQNNMLREALALALDNDEYRYSKHQQGVPELMKYSEAGKIDRFADIGALLGSVRGAGSEDPSKGLYSKVGGPLFGALLQSLVPGSLIRGGRNIYNYFRGNDINPADRRKRWMQSLGAGGLAGTLLNRPEFRVNRQTWRNAPAETKARLPFGSFFKTMNLDARRWEDLHNKGQTAKALTQLPKDAHPLLDMFSQMKKITGLPYRAEVQYDK